MSESLVWLIGAVVCLLAAPRVQLSADSGSGWPRSACGIISSCQSAASFEIVTQPGHPSAGRQNEYWR